MGMIKKGDRVKWADWEQSSVEAYRTMEGEVIGIEEVVLRNGKVRRIYAVLFDMDKEAGFHFSHHCSEDRLVVI